MSDKKLLIEISTEELEEKLISLENEREAISYTIGNIENELFFRKHPECRTKISNERKYTP
jgi:hypothetical protein